MSQRVVLCRGYDADRGYLVFFTNTESRKGIALGAMPRASALFHWDALQRQVRIEGPVVASPDEEMQRHFDTRHPAAQIGMWASAQSRPIESRDAFLRKLALTTARFGEGPIPRPPHWGGYRLFIERIEFWVGAAGRAHDRGCWTRSLVPEGSGYRGDAWAVTRLQP